LAHAPTTYRPDGGWHILHRNGDEEPDQAQDDTVSKNWRLSMRASRRGVRPSHTVIINCTEARAHREARTLAPDGYTIVEMPQR
jgi:hypothetical protein